MQHQVVSHEEWLAARKALLADEKEFTRRRDRLSAQRYTPGSARENSYVAIAYTNRAVASMMAKDSVSAKSDLDRAKSLAPSAEYVSRNIAAVQTKGSTIAKLDVAPAR